jgi:hypothetical protein
VNLWSLRVALLILFAATIPALQYIASRFLSPWGAGLSVLLAVTWSVPNYPAAVPSWYNLCFAIMGLAALLRFMDRGGPGWLVAAGVAGGLSFLVKIPGLFYLAGGVLALVFHEQEVRRGDAPGGKGPAAYRLFVISALILFVAALGVFVAARPGLRTLVHFVLPGAALAALLAVREAGVAGPSAPRFAALARLVGPFLGGAALPVAAFLMPYAAAGAVPDLVRGVFLLPASRLTFAAMEPPPLGLSLLAAMPLVLYLAAERSGPWPRWMRLVAIVGMGGALSAISGESPAYQLIWQSVRFLVPTVVIAGVLVLGSRWGRALPPARRDQLFLLLALTAMVSLVQFPFSAPVYFFYVAPLAMLTIALLLETMGVASRFTTVSAAVFYLLFALLFVNRSSIYGMGLVFVRNAATVRLDLPRGGIRVRADDAAVYRTVVELVDRHATGRHIFAAPDCPEVYFLTGRANPLPTLFEFLDPVPPDSASVLESLRTHDVRVVVINRRPDFSGTMDRNLRAALARQFPDSVRTGSFVVRWKS